MSKNANPDDPVGKPHDYDKALSVAYLRLIDKTQEEAAELAGVSPRTVHSWEHSSWWPECEAEAGRRWLRGLEAKARSKLQSDMDASLALKILERRLPELAPPALKAEHQFPEELKIRVVYDDVG
jgi:hypothetical protein